MGIPPNTHQAASNAAAALGSWVSLHTGTGGGTTGANEASGGGYGRQQTTWVPDGQGDNIGNSVVVPCQAGTYSEAGVFSAVTGGTFVGSAAFADGSIVVTGLGAGVMVVPIWSA